MNSVDLFGYRISNRDLKGNIDTAMEMIGEWTGTTRYMACANPHSLVIASRDSVFQKALRKADMLLPDGSGIILAARILRLSIPGKIAGFDFFHGLSKLAQAHGGIRYFFLGSSPMVLEMIVSRINSEFPKIHICGTYSPPFKPEFSPSDNESMINAINSARPHVLWVGMTAPKQEKWIYNHLKYLRVPFAGAIGAVFDFYAGTKQRSSEFWIKMGLEWLPRFVREPGRLWERNLKSTPIFLGWIIREKLKIITR